MKTRLSAQKPAYFLITIHLYYFKYISLYIFFGLIIIKTNYSISLPFRWWHGQIASLAQSIERFELILYIEKNPMPSPFFHNFCSAPSHVGPFSHAVEFEGWVQLTGQMPTDPNNDKAPLPKGVRAQTQRVMENLIIILDELELDLQNVLVVRVFLTKFKRDYDIMNKVYKTYFPKDKLPARTCIGVTALARNALVEIDMLAKRF